MVAKGATEVSLEYLGAAMTKKTARMFWKSLRSFVNDEGWGRRDVCRPISVFVYFLATGSATASSSVSLILRPIQR